MSGFEQRTSGRKRPLYQLSHNHILLLFMLDYWVDPFGRSLPTPHARGSNPVMGNYYRYNI